MSKNEKLTKIKTQLQISYRNIISLENLFVAWQEFVVGKKKKKDVEEFGFRLTGNIIELHDDLSNFTYSHGKYVAFNISDPKPRNIHKASVRDRVLHHAIYRQLYPFFDRTFIADSYSCRVGKGVHKALDRFRSFGYRVSKNHTRTVWILKCDIKKFFASIDHEILIGILRGYIPNKGILWLLEKVIESFQNSTSPFIPPLVPRPWARGRMARGGGERSSRGLPLGNLTSQLFCNVYMNEFDQFVKHKLKVKYYIRYADDFVLLSYDKKHLENLVPLITSFLQNRLQLSLHPDKVFIKTLASGADFLGWTHFSYYQALRSTTKRRMFKQISQNPKNQVLQSYIGLLSHGNAFKVKADLLNSYYLWGGKPNL